MSDEQEIKGKRNEEGERKKEREIDVYKILHNLPIL